MQIVYSQFVCYTYNDGIRLRQLLERGIHMAISYNGLWKLLIDNNMKKGDLCAKTGLSSSTIAKMTNCESVKLSVLEKICKELDCNFGDLVDYVPDEEEK